MLTHMRRARRMLRWHKLSENRCRVHVRSAIAGDPEIIRSTISGMMAERRGASTGSAAAQSSLELARALASHRASANLSLESTEHHGSGSTCLAFDGVESTLSGVDSLTPE